MDEKNKSDSRQVKELGSPSCFIVVCNQVGTGKVFTR